MTYPVDNSQPGIAKCAKGDTLCDAYPQYMRASPSGGCGNTCAPLRAFTNKKVSNLWLGGYTMAQSMLVNSALRMHPEEFAIGVGAGAAAAHMALSHGAVVSTEQAVTTPKIVSEIRSRILRHAPLSNEQPPRSWPAAVGVVCADVLARCVEVPGGGAFNKNNTKPRCLEQLCQPLRSGEWLAVEGGFSYEPTTDTVVFHSATKLKKSTINSSLLKREEVLPVARGQRLHVLSRPSPPFRVDEYSYIPLRCTKEQC